MMTSALARIASLCALGLACALGSSARAQTQDPASLRIQILSGKTGRPITNQHILLTTADKKLHNDQKTDGEGYATLPGNVLPETITTLQVFVDLHVPCSKTAVRTFSVAAARAKGIVSDNSCSSRIKLFPQAGTLVFFVRDETFFERIRH